MLTRHNTGTNATPNWYVITELASDWRNDGDPHRKNSHLPLLIDTALPALVSSSFFYFYFDRGCHEFVQRELATLPNTGLKVHTPHTVLSNSFYLFLSLITALTCILILSSFQSVLKPFGSRTRGNRLPAAANIYPKIWFLNFNHHAVILIDKFRQSDLLPSSCKIYWGTYSVGSDRQSCSLSPC